MKPFYFLFIISLLFQKLLAQDLSQIIKATPKCSLECLLPRLPIAALTSLNDTLCTNITLQSQLSTCVQTTCKFSDQIIAGDVQSSLCARYPKESRSDEILIVTAVLSAVTFPVVILKFYTRWSTSRSLWADDYAALVATVFLLLMAGIEIASAKLGLGTHYWFIPASDGVLLLKLFYAVQVAYVMIQVFAKTSLLLLYHRIFTTPWFKMACKIGIVFLVTHGSAYILVIIFQCKPIASIWNKHLTGKCVDLPTVGLSGAIFSIIEDVVILLLPLPECKNLQIGKKKKWALGLMFSVGSFACVTSIVRLRYILQFSNTFDSTWDNTDVVKWSLIEVFTAVLCACLPSLRTFFRRTFTFFHSTLRSSDNTADSRSRPTDNRSHQLSNLHNRKKMKFDESTTELSPYSVGDVDDGKPEETELSSPGVTRPPAKPMPTLRSKYNERESMS